MPVIAERQAPVITAGEHDVTGPPLAAVNPRENRSVHLTSRECICPGAAIEFGHVGAGAGHHQGVLPVV
jgi:hypothetical protein